MNGKTLLLVRHGKSSWRHPGLEDALRPLNARGYRQGPLLRLELAALLPDRSVNWACSPAVRAYTTCRMLTDCLPQLVPALYPGDPDAIRAWLAGQPASVMTLALVGHNPAMEQSAHWLTGERRPLKTAEAVAIELQIQDWRQTAPEFVSNYHWLSSGV